MTLYFKPTTTYCIIILGHGMIGQALLDLIDHWPCFYDLKIHVLSSSFHDERFHLSQQKMGLSRLTRDVVTLNSENFATILSPLLSSETALINLTVDVDSFDIAELCGSLGALYIDTSLETWLDSPQPAFLSDSVLKIIHPHHQQGYPTALFSHGSNPGWVNHLAKATLIQLSEQMRFDEQPTPSTREQWSSLCRRLGVEHMNITEIDTQHAPLFIDNDTFASTWSPKAFWNEGSVPSECGVGSFPSDLESGWVLRPNTPFAYHPHPAATLFSQGWSPSQGYYQGMIIPHEEVLTLPFYFEDSSSDEVWRPSSRYIYLPSPLSRQSFLSAQLSSNTPQKWLPLKEQLIEGFDEIGVMLQGKTFGTYWMGFTLDLLAARSIHPLENATTLSVAAGVLSGLSWILQHPNQGWITPDDLPFFDILPQIAPFAGTLKAYHF